MSLKKYFEITDKIKSLSGKTADQIGSQVESVAYHEQDIIEEERFIPRVDFSDPKNFARYGSAEEYYEQSVKRIYNEYPYDGSLREKLEWRNESTYIDLHVFDNLYPRTNGYIIHGLNWGTTRTMTDGYGDPADDEYIFVKGGPNANPNGMSPKSTQFTGSNYYEPSMNRASNLEFDLTTHGATLEFWMNKTEFITGSTEKEVIFDLWNGALSSSADYLRFRLELSGTTSGADPWLLTVISGTTGFQSTSVAASSITTASVADGNWHHYAVTVKSDTDNDVIETRFYVDGNLNRQQLLGKAVNDTDGSSHRAYIGALIAPPSSSTAVASAGKLSASLDELRYWKTQRSSEEIGRFWFTQVGGGVNTDPTPLQLQKSRPTLTLVCTLSLTKESLGPAPPTAQCWITLVVSRMVHGLGMRLVPDRLDLLLSSLMRPPRSSKTRLSTPSTRMWSSYRLVCRHLAQRTIMKIMLQFTILFLHGLLKRIRRAQRMLSILHRSSPATLIPCTCRLTV